MRTRSPPNSLCCEYFSHYDAYYVYDTPSVSQWNTFKLTLVRWQAKNPVPYLVHAEIGLSSPAAPPVAMPVARGQSFRRDRA